MIVPPSIIKEEEEKRVWVTNDLCKKNSTLRTIPLQPVVSGGMLQGKHLRHYIGLLHPLYLWESQRPSIDHDINRPFTPRYYVIPFLVMYIAEQYSLEVERQSVNHNQLYCGGLWY